MIEKTQSLIPLLLLSAKAGELSRVDAGSRLERLATCLEGVSNPQPVRSTTIETAQQWQTLPARVNGYLEALEQVLVPRAGNTEEAPHAHG